MRVLLLIMLFAAAALLWATVSIATHVRRARRRRRRELAAMGVDTELPLFALGLERASDVPVALEPAPVEFEVESEPFDWLDAPASIGLSSYAAIPGSDPVAASPVEQDPLPVIAAESGHSKPLSALDRMALEKEFEIVTASEPAATERPMFASFFSPADVHFEPPLRVEPDTSFVSEADVVEREPELAFFAPTPSVEPVSAAAVPALPKFSPWEAGDIEEQQAREGRLRAVFAPPVAAEPAPAMSKPKSVETPPQAEVRGFPPRASAVGRHPLSALAGKVERLDWAYFNKDLGDLTDPYEVRRPPAAAKPNSRVLPRDRASR